MTKASVGASWQRSIIVLTFTVVSVVAIAILYWAQSIFIPVALAAFLTFLLSPVVTWLLPARSRSHARRVHDGLSGGVRPGDGGLGGHDPDFQPAAGITQV